jgi:hypothetical protein
MTFLGVVPAYGCWHCLDSRTWLVATVSEDHTASVIKAEVRIGAEWSIKT